MKTMYRPSTAIAIKYTDAFPRLQNTFRLTKRIKEDFYVAIGAEDSSGFEPLFAWSKDLHVYYLAT